MGGSMPPMLCVTAQRTDIAILDKHEKKIYLLELTCQFEQGCRKRNKYRPIFTDITQYSCKVYYFEVSTMSFINSRNHSTLNTINKFIKQTEHICTFTQCIAPYFICRNYPHLPGDHLPTANYSVPGQGDWSVECGPEWTAWWDLHPVLGQCTLCTNPIYVQPIQ